MGTSNPNSNFENALRKAFSYLGSSNWTTDVYISRKTGVKVMVLNTTFNNISVIWWL
jgi:hypothetical protein